MPDTLVKSFTHLKDRTNADRALHMLQRIASLVKPIMRKHSWVLPVLSEFYPDNPHLVGLNVNGGQKILLRLRLPHDSGSFYDEEQVVLVMLHELTHNVHGTHDDKFYKFLAGLEAEWEALKRTGYSGEGFFSKGQRLGTNVSHNVPQHMARAKALEAAEKRRNVSNMMGGGGRLGGSIPSTRNLSPRELAAQAAERRARDAKACASGADAEREAAKAAQESIESKAIDLTSDSDDEAIIADNPVPVAGLSKAAITQSKETAGASALPKAGITLDDEVIIIDNPASGISQTKEAISASELPKTSNTTGINDRKPDIMPAVEARGPTKTSKQVPSEWACPMCTLFNPWNALKCDACLTVRTVNEVEGWTCHVCGEYPMPHDFWTCRFCGSVKTTS